jgi:hypothetical protein
MSFAIALTLAFGALMRVVWLAVDEARTARAETRPSFDDVFGRGPWRFVITVVALTLPVLMTMELFDIVADGRRLDDVTDLLGGSALLALALAIPVAALVALMVRSIARIVGDSHRALVAVIGQLIALVAQVRRRVGECSYQASRRSRLRQSSFLSRPSGKRGPPLRVC